MQQNKIIKIRPNSKPWFNSTVKLAYKQCHKAYKLKIKTNNPIHIEDYKQKRTSAKNAFRKARNDYYDHLTEKIMDKETTPKSYWKLVKSIFNSNKQSSIPTLFDDNISYTNDQDKAELLNNYFVSQSILPPSNVPLPPFITSLMPGSVR